MIHKLLSELPFNPSMIEEVSFYTRRLNREKSIQLLGLVFVILSLFVQTFAALVPPENSVQASSNDVLTPGANALAGNNKAEIEKKCIAHADVRGLYNRFGLVCEKISGVYTAPEVDFNFQSKGADGVKTVGRINFPFTDDDARGPWAGVTFYSRSAAEWQGSEKAYDFGVRTGSDGNKFHVWVLKKCGNIAYHRIATPPPPTPVPAPTPSHVTTPVPVKTVPAPAPTPVTPTPTTPTSTPPPVTPTPPVTPPTVTPPGLQKTARNITQNLSTEQTPSSNAKAGDVIEYTLITTNTSSSSSIDTVVEDYVGDILDYADIDQAFLAGQNGVYVADKKTVTWNQQTIAKSAQLKKTFRVVMKNPLPLTNQPNVTAPDFDCKMQNVYGNEVAIPVDCAVIKAVEQLPNTGPGTAVGIAFTITVVSSYFFARNRLMAKELTILKKEYTSSGALN